MTLARAELSGEINKKHDNSITAQQKFLKKFSKLPCNLNLCCAIISNELV